ncbi:hypothetical protein [Desulfofalx alkaliphila]|uniref:hypothetical protein n=1 Tax=Desulfofalx alkaliphila TaxID=105483 RepID=UPI0004E0EAEC|nr:hypothetical protein [Desulfofalx alkaliphila]
MTSTDILILGIVFGALFVYYLTKLVRSYKLKRQSKTARRAERAAQNYLEDQGYTIVSAQQRVPILTKVDNRDYKNHVKADFIVKKGGYTYVVEVKTGKQVERPTSAEIRRQLLEYYLIYRTNGVLLLDMENKKIHTVQFQIKLPKRADSYISHAIAFGAGVLVVLLLIKGGVIF